ncbi:hypothetical protein Tco_0252954 [Tanacetum coccineum]
MLGTRMIVSSEITFSTVHWTHQPNGGGLKKCILNGPLLANKCTYSKLFQKLNDRPQFNNNTANETVKLEQDSTRTKEHIHSEKEAIFLLLLVLEMKSTQLLMLCNTYYQEPKPQRSNATSSSKRPSASTRHKGKEIAKPITPPSESVSVSDEDSDPEQAQRDKEMQKNLALLAKYFKKLYKPTNNNLRTSSNSRNKTEDTTPRYNNDNQSRQFGNQRTMTVAGASRNLVGNNRDENSHNVAGKADDAGNSNSCLVGKDGRENGISKWSTEGGGLCCSAGRGVDPGSSRQVLVLRKAFIFRSLILPDALILGKKALWRIQFLGDKLIIGFNYNKIPLYCDSQSAIAISCNPYKFTTKHNPYSEGLYEMFVSAELEVLTNEPAVSLIIFKTSLVKYF